MSQANVVRARPWLTHEHEVTGLTQLKWWARHDFALDIAWTAWMQINIRQTGNFGEIGSGGLFNLGHGFVLLVLANLMPWSWDILCSICTTQTRHDPKRRWGGTGNVMVIPRFCDHSTRAYSSVYHEIHRMIYELVYDCGTLTSLKLTHTTIQDWWRWRFSHIIQNVKPRV
jgi:hypothetical protein